MYTHRFGNVTVQDIDALLEPLEQAHARIVPREHARGAGEIDQDRQQRRQMPVHPLRQCLDDENVCVAIDDQRRQHVCLSMHEPERCRVDGQRLAKGQGRRQPLVPEGVVHLLVPTGEHAQADLRSIAVEGTAQEPLTRTQHLDDGPRVGRDIVDVTLVDPGMPAPDSSFGTRGDDGCGYHVSCSLSLPLPTMQLSARGTSWRFTHPDRGHFTVRFVHQSCYVLSLLQIRKLLTPSGRRSHASSRRSSSSPQRTS